MNTNSNFQTRSGMPRQIWIAIITIITINRVNVNSILRWLVFGTENRGGDEGFICRGGNLLTWSSDMGGCQGQPNPKRGRAS